MMSSERAEYGDPGTRRGILEAAWELIEEGSSSVKVAEVANRAGVSRQAVYLHFGDRAGLLVALVHYMDQDLGLDQAAVEIMDQPTGEGALAMMVMALSVFAPKIDTVARILDSAQYEDDEVAAAWRDRMAGRQTLCRSIVQRIFDEGRLDDGWSVDSASELAYVLTMPGPWRELTQNLGWTPEQYAQNLTTALRRSLLRN